MTEGRIVRTEKTVRGPFGQLVKWLFIAFNVLMLFWMVTGLAAVGGTYSNATSNAAQAGTAIGGAIGASFILFIWLAGDVILGTFVLITRGKKVITEERVA